MLKKISLRLRFTLFMAFVLTVACILLTFGAMYAYRLYSNPVLRDGSERMPIEENQGFIISNPNNQFDSTTLLLCAAIILIGSGATYLIARKALKPITDLSESIEEIDGGNLFVRVKETEARDEVSRLSNSFNHMIDKLESAFLSQKNFSANAAHELKTPLAAMISNVEVCQLEDEPSPTEYRETLNEVLENAERLNTLVDDLLTMTTETSVALKEKFDAREMFGKIINELSPANDKEIRFSNQASAITLTGDKSLLYRAFFNLVHNAIKYNRPNGTVTISAENIGFTAT
jgi:signal transduction histidine kinase